MHPVFHHNELRTFFLLPVLYLSAPTKEVAPCTFEAALDLLPRDDTNRGIVAARQGDPLVNACIQSVQTAQDMGQILDRPAIGVNLVEDVIAGQKQDVSRSVPAPCRLMLVLRPIEDDVNLSHVAECTPILQLLVEDGVEIILGMTHSVEISKYFRSNCGKKDGNGFGVRASVVE